MCDIYQCSRRWQQNDRTRRDSIIDLSLEMLDVATFGHWFVWPPIIESQSVNHSIHLETTLRSLRRKIFKTTDLAFWGALIWRHEPWIGGIMTDRKRLLDRSATSAMGLAILRMDSPCVSWSRGNKRWFSGHYEARFSRVYSLYLRLDLIDSVDLSDWFFGRVDRQRATHKPLKR